MRKNTYFAIGILCGAAALFAACSAKKPQTATLALASNPTTGYEWTCVQEEELFNVGQEFAENTGSVKDQVGAGGQDIFTLTPKAAGTTTLTFKYSRPWEDNEDDMQIRYEVKINKAMQIEVESISADNLAGDIETVPTVPQFEIK